MVKPHVSVGINRSAQSSSHPAFKSFLEVVLQKPSAEEDKHIAIPQAQCFLCFTQFCFAAPSFSSFPYLSLLSFNPSLLISPSFPLYFKLSVALFVPTLLLLFLCPLIVLPSHFASIPFLIFCPHSAVFLQTSVISLACSSLPTRVRK